MFLERLELQGFKSFATKTALEFGRGITAIVGPNGSGKSNIADAIRWVLGEQSLKLIRGKRSEDVIFAGSDRKTRLGAAEVSLYLNNEDGAAPIDFSELVITRRVYRDGSGEYLVNKRQVRLQDILMLLAKSNFGQRTYSVIGQGMVDSILMTSPEERKHFFDEAAGVRQFQLKRDQAVTKLERTYENLRQAEALIKEIEPRVRSLTRQVRRLERRSEIEQQLLALQTSYYRGLLYDLKSKLRVSQERNRELDEKRKGHDARVSELHAELTKLERDQSRSEAFASLQRAFEQTQTEKSALLAEQAVLKGQREREFTERGHAHVIWFERQADGLNQRISDLEHDQSTTQAALETKETKARGIERTLEAKQREYTDLEADLHEGLEDVQKKTVSVPELQGEFQDFVRFEEVFIKELNDATTLDAVVALKKKTVELDVRTKRFAEKLGRLTEKDVAERIVSLQKNLQKVAADRIKITESLNAVRLSIGLYKEKLSLLETDLVRLREERERIERELERARAEGTENVAATLRDQNEVLSKKIAEIDVRLSDITKKIQDFNARESAKRDELFRIQHDLRQAQDALNGTTAQLSEIRIEVARLETRLQDIEREIRDEVSEASWSDILKSTEAIPKPTPEQAEEIQRMKHHLGLIGGIDESIEKEYKETKERYTFLKTQYDDLTKAAAQLEQGIVELDKTIKERFDDAFRKINEEFGKYFKTLFQGGSAKLILQREVIEEEPEVEESEERVEEKGWGTPPRPSLTKGGPRGGGERVITGIDIQATPPGKRLKGLAMLSGGERALTSIALICAIILNNPMPFAVLDEVDAALDEANSQRFAAILEQLARKTQFLMITHNRATMEKSNVLYGVTMGDDGVSKLLSVKLEEAEHVIKKFGNR